MPASAFERQVLAARLPGYRPPLLDQLGSSGEIVCGTTLDLGRLRLDCAFLRWHMDGREGIGRYDILRRVDQP